MPSKKEKILNQLKEEILSLQLKPGTIISENTLSERFGLSRTPIRDILKQLSLEGYINIYPQRGNLVSFIDLDSVEQLVYLRSTLEKEIFKDLCGNVSLKGIHELRSILARQAACVTEHCESREFIQYDDDFHKQVYILAGREFLWNLIQQFNVHYVRYRELHMLKTEKMAALVKEHEHLLEIISSGDSREIDSLIYSHIRSDVKSKYFQEHFAEFIKRD